MSGEKTISLILAHPDQKSFNHAIAQQAAKTLRQRGYRVWFHDLYQEKFDPLLFHKEFPKTTRLPENIKTHCREIAKAFGIVIVHPNWFGQPPAILKGWIDRVLRPGVAYKFLPGDKGEGIPVGLLKAGTAVVFNTANTPPEREQGEFGDPLEILWKKCIFKFCGVNKFARRTFRVVVTSTPDQRRKWLEEVAETVCRLFPPSLPAKNMKGPL
jgi:putative NADPH-quinone reductase